LLIGGRGGGKRIHARLAIRKGRRKKGIMCRKGWEWTLTGGQILSSFLKEKGDASLSYTEGRLKEPKKSLIGGKKKGLGT